MVVTSFGRDKNPDDEIKNREKTEKSPSYRCAAIKKRKKNKKIKTVTNEKRNEQIDR